MRRAPTIAGVLRERAESSESNRIGIRFSAAGDWIEWTWQQYWTAAQAAAASLAELGVRRGDHVLMLTPEVRPAVAALFGAWTIGAVPVQIAMPFALHNREEFLARLVDTARRLDARYLLTTAALSALAPAASPIRVINTDDLMRGGDTTSLPDPDAAEGPAFIQLTSGSTSRPRGVVVLHDRLMRHMRSMSERLPNHSGAAAVSWLPLHHDMGLLGGLLFPFYNGFTAHMIATAEFQARPAVWFEALSRFRGTITAAPPSAYGLCVALAPLLLNKGMDLSAWECAMVGAEPISAAVLRRFAAAFAPMGFRKEAFFPVYGLAEATVAVSFPPLLRETRVDAIDRAALEQHALAMPSQDQESSLEFVCVGTPISETEVRIVGADGGLQPDRAIGEVHVRSTTLAVAYYGDADATSAAFRDGWLHTGDLGYLADGELFVTGRVKELIIKGGHNLIPSYLEEIVGEVSGVRAGSVAAVGVRSPEYQTELVCIVAEARCEPDEYGALSARIREALSARGVVPDKIVVVPPKTLPKTTSGKLQRLAISRQLATELVNVAGAASRPLPVRAD